MRAETPARSASAGSKPQRRGRFLLELWVGAFVVLACLGAFFGPGVYWSIRIGRLEKELVERGPELDYEPLSRLMRMRNVYAKDAICRYANRSPTRCWVPETGALFLVSEKKHKRSADQAPIEIVLCFRRGVASKRVESHCVGVIVTRIARAGERLAVDFKVHPELAMHARTSADRIWTLRYSLEEAMARGVLDESVSITGSSDWKSDTITAYVRPLISTAEAQMAGNGED